MPPSALEWGLKEEAKRRAPKSKLGTRASRGERVLGALFPNRSYGWPGGWSQNRLEQVFHFKNWTYNCVDTIASKIGELIPNLAYVRDHQVPGKTFKSWDARAAFGGTSSFYHAGNYFHPHHKKALSVVKPHEELEPLPYNHRLRRLIENPNPVDTSFDLLYELSMFLDLTGIGYIWMVPNDWGIVSELWIIPSHWVWPRTGGGAYVAPDNPYSERLVQYYEVRPWGGVSGAGALRFPPNEVIMVKWKSPINKIDGYSKLSAISTWIDSEESIGNSRWSQFMNQGLPGIAVECAASVDDPDDNRIARMEAKFMQKLQGEFNTGKPWFIPSGTKVTPLSFNPQQMMYLETEEQIRDNILATFRVPKAVIGLSQDMTYGSILAGLAGFCLDEKTECLTANGWKKYYELDKNTRIACYDEPTGTIVYRKPEKIINFNYEGPMHKWKSERIDALMTPGHKVYVKRSSHRKHINPPWEKTLIDNLTPTTHYKIKRAAPAACDEPVAVGLEKYGGYRQREFYGIETIDPETWLEFLGWWLSEGHMGKRPERGSNSGWIIGITQSKKNSHKKHCKEISECLKATPFRWKKVETGKDYCNWTWKVSDKGLYEHLKKHCGTCSFDKRIPEYVKAWPAESLLVLLNALVMGDGSPAYVNDNTGVWNSQYGTSSKQLADDVLEIAVKCGLGASIYHYKDEREKYKGRDRYIVNMSSRSETGMWGNHRSMVHYNGTVWCVQVPTGLFVVRRNGKPHITGNCSFSINPRLIMLGLQLSKFLAPIFAREGESIRIWWDDSSPADPAQVNSDIEVDYRCQAISPNEIRSLRGRHGWAHGGKDPMGSGPMGVQPIPMETGEDLQEFADLIAPMAAVGQQPGGEPGPEGIPGGPPQEPEGAEGTPEGAVPQEEAVKPPEPGEDVNVLSGIQEPNGPPQKAKKYKPCPRCGQKTIQGNGKVLWCDSSVCSWTKKIGVPKNRIKALMKPSKNGIHRKLLNQL